MSSALVYTDVVNDHGHQGPVLLAVHAALDAIYFANGIDLRACHRDLAEICPKCGAESLEPCVRRGKKIAPHYARTQVAGLRFARGFVPEIGEAVAIGVEWNPWRALFIGFTPKGEVHVDAPGRYTKSDALSVIGPWECPHGIERMNDRVGMRDPGLCPCCLGVSGSDLPRDVCEGCES